MKNLSFFKNLFLIFLSVFVSILIFEVLTRVFVYKYLNKTVFHFDFDSLYFDKEINHHALKKSYISYQTNGYFKEKIVTDKHSFRINENQIDIFDPEIITIGDSQTFGHAIDNKDTWPNLLSEKISTRVGNWGVWGYGVPNYEIKINRAIKQFTPKLIILGLTDNDICSLKYEKNISDTKRYKDFLNYNKQSLFNYLIYNPKSVFINWTGTGKTLYSFYQNYFKHTEIVKKYKKFFKKNNKDTDDYLLNCSKELKKWIFFVSQKLNSQNVKFLVVSLPNPRRVLNYSKGNKHYGYENAIRFLNVNSLNNYYFINTIDNLSNFIKENNYNLERIIVPSDGHYNFQANNIISDMIFNKIRNKNILEK